MPRILYIQYTNPGGYPPLEHSSRILADAGWQVLFLGTGALGLGRFHFAAHPRITVRRLEFQPAGWRQKLHYLWFCLWCFAWAVKWRPQWLYASDMFSCPPALLVGRLLQIPILYHEHDSPATDTSGRFTRMCLLARKACARGAKLSVLPNHQRAKQFAAETTPRHRVEVVWNCPSRAEAVSRATAQPGDGLRLLYHGSIVPDRLPMCVLDALAALPDDVSLRIVGYETVGSLGYVDQLRSRAAVLKISHRIEILGPVSCRSELLDLCRTCDVGFALMPAKSKDLNLRAMTGASNKAFDYLACGLAVLVSDLPDWREMFVQPKYGLSCDPSEPESIAAAVRYFYENPDARRNMAMKGQDRIRNGWNYETQFQPVMQILRCS